MALCVIVGSYLWSDIHRTFNFTPACGRVVTYHHFVRCYMNFYWESFFLLYFHVIRYFGRSSPSW